MTDVLTAREIQVLSERAKGKTIKAVAHDLGISEQTAKNHVQHAFAKLGVSSLTQAMLELSWTGNDRAGWIRARLVAERARYFATRRRLRAELRRLES